MSVRVMVVDDTEHVRRMLVDILRLHGFDIVAEASNGAEAVDTAEQMLPDIIVMDYKMPGLDGIEASEQVREKLPGQAVILYSAYIDRGLQDRAREAGIAACVAKGSGVESLATEISAIAMDLGGPAAGDGGASR